MYRCPVRCPHERVSQAMNRQYLDDLRRRYKRDAVVFWIAGLIGGVLSAVRKPHRLAKTAIFSSPDRAQTPSNDYFLIRQPAFDARFRLLMSQAATQERALPCPSADSAFLVACLASPSTTS